MNFQLIAGTVDIEGEAIHGNALWQPFSVRMVREPGEWTLRSVSLGGLAYKQ
jgi:hypothetical protein